MSSAPHPGSGRHTVRSLHSGHLGFLDIIVGTGPRELMVSTLLILAGYGGVRSHVEMIN